ncbi:uncharacterized protein LOC123912470 isoform X4 [Trifolium pratense]|uniref:Uncharacterized protein n=1 Tax=Trifolium pratense TaxID=57577 RepID=A0ACB0M3Z6_TRIPR|nr:uncharacterized protein LOC123912470 isoform X4 [Trifolium pratense]XP_045819182.1 uncharacterized protein LOC123912470 isoform X4 [Trifolium pratense]CAJ2674162.1 unnamed protein product [Trifolium pratense]
MAAESNTGFHYGDMNSSLNWHAISFQSGAVSSLPEMVPMGNYFGLNNDTSGMMYSGNSSIVNSNSHVISQQGNASGCSLLVDSVPGLKHDAGLAAEWSVDEQYKLEEGLLKYADEPSIMRYVKIAASLRDKTVRDVALRCRWMTRKRRKSEDHMLKKANNRKDKPVESSPKQYLQPVVTTYSCIPHHMDRSQRIVYDDGVCGPMKRLLEQNAQAFSQINSNLSTFKLQDNIDLLCQTRRNISTILDDMREMPGIMSQMLPLPVSIDEDLACSILPNKTQLGNF